MNELKIRVDLSIESYWRDPPTPTEQAAQQMIDARLRVLALTIRRDLEADLEREMNTAPIASPTSASIARKLARKLRRGTA